MLNLADSVDLPDPEKWLKALFRKIPKVFYAPPKTAVAANEKVVACLPEELKYYYALLGYIKHLSEHLESEHAQLPEHPQDICDNYVEQVKFMLVFYNIIKSILYYKVTQFLLNKHQLQIANFEIREHWQIIVSPETEQKSVNQGISSIDLEKFILNPLFWRGYDPKKPS